MSLSFSLPPATGTDSCVLTKRCLRRWCLVQASGWRGANPAGRRLLCACSGRETPAPRSERGAPPLRGRLSASTSGAELEHSGKRSTFGFGEDIQTFTGMRCFVSGGSCLLFFGALARGRLRRRRSRRKDCGCQRGCGRAGRQSWGREERPGRA